MSVLISKMKSGEGLMYLENKDSCEICIDLEISSHLFNHQ